MVCPKGSVIFGDEAVGVIVTVGVIVAVYHQRVAGDAIGERIC